MKMGETWELRARTKDNYRPSLVGSGYGLGGRLSIKLMKILTSKSAIVYTLQL